LSLIFLEIFYLLGYLHIQVERIIADRISKDDSGDVIPEYLVKWQGLSYAEVTWYVTLNLVDLFFVHFLCIRCLHIRKDDG
jgi:hypothetical protein